MTEGTENTGASAPVHAFVHTPRPWKVRARFDVVQDLGIYGGYFVGSTRGNSDALPANVRAQDEANARLIAAAPDLLAALNDLLYELPRYSGGLQAERIVAARDAIEKATGKSWGPVC